MHPSKNMLLALLLSLLFVQSLTKSTTPKADYNFNLAYLERLKSTSKAGYIELNQDQLKKFSLIDHEKRDFNLFILFTSLDPSTGCGVCPQVSQSYRHMISIFERKAKKGPLPSFFASVEFKGNMEAFQMVGVERIPTFVYFGPEARAPKFMSNGAVGDIAQLIEFITKNSKSSINLEEAMKPEPNHNGLVAGIAVAVLVVGLLATGTMRPETLFQNVYIWGALVLGFIVVMLSGTMWVKIRNAPFVGSTNGRDILYFANSLQSQMGIESRIIAGLVSAAALMSVIGPVFVSKFNGNNKRQVAALVASLVYMAAHAGLIKAFMFKMPSYPLPYIF